MTSPRKPSSPRRADEPEGVDPDDALGRAPRAAAPAVPRDAPAPTRPSATTAGADLAAGLAAAFAEHVQRALGLPLDGSETSLAFVDHYLRTARDGTRGPIAALVAAEAGAYYGELVRQLLGAQWIGEGSDPRRLRLLLEHQFLHFSPIDQAHEILAGLREDDDDDDDDGDAPDPDEPPLDTAFHARSTPAATHPDAPTDASWLADRLAELPPVAAGEYYSLTCRFETLKLVLELLATKHMSEGRSPRTYTLDDYLAALAPRH